MPSYDYKESRYRTIIEMRADNKPATIIARRLRLSTATIYREMRNLRKIGRLPDAVRDRRARADQMIVDGIDTEDICEACGIQPCTVAIYRGILQRAGLVQSVRQTDYWRDLKPKVLELLDQGLRPFQIAEILDCKLPNLTQHMTIWRSFGAKIPRFAGGRAKGIPQIRIKREISAEQSEARSFRKALKAIYRAH